MAALAFGHSHVWQFIELDFAAGGAVRRFECRCGAIDFDAVGGSSG